MAHNKKRNTAFLFESLMREGTKAVVEKDLKKANFIKSTIVKYFSNGTELKKELSLYKAFDGDAIDYKNSEKYLQEVKFRHSLIDKKKLFNEQTSLINLVNKTIGPSFYNNFIPNYKNIASISQIFNDQTPIKEKILLETTIIEQFKKEKEFREQENLQPVDKIVLKTFTKKFNEKYSGLLEEQKNLLGKFVNSFSDEGLELKIFLNEEIERLKTGVSNALQTEEIKSDKEMEEKTLKIQNFLQTFKENREISKELLEKVIKIQQFVHEVNN